MQHGNDTLYSIQLATLICPRPTSADVSKPISPFGVTNYVGNMGGPGQLAGFTGTIVSGPLGWGPDQGNLGWFHSQRSGRNLEHGAVQ